MAEEKQKKHFFGDIKKELKKVIWPTKKQTAKNTLSVIAIVFLVSFIVIVFDFILVKANDFTIDKATGGKVTQYKVDIERKTEILNEIKQYVDEEKYMEYAQIAYYMSVEDLQKVLEDLKNPPVEDENASGEEGETGSEENTGDQTNPDETTQE